MGSNFKSETQSRTEADVKAGIGKARAAFLQLKNIWNSNVLSLENKIRILNTNVNRRDMEDQSDHNKEDMIQIFANNSCLRRIIGVWWPEIIIINERL